MQLFDCTDIKALLSGIVDDQLEPTTRHEVERHLSDCADCRALVGRAESLDSLVALDAESFAAANLSTDFVERVLDQTVRRDHSRRRFTAFLFRTGALLSAAAVVTFAAVFWLNGSPRRPVSDTRHSNVAGISLMPRLPFGIEESFPAPDVDLAINRSSAPEPVEVADSVPSLLDRSHPAIAFSDPDPSSTVIADIRWSAQPQPIPTRTLSVDDADALYSASILLSMIADNDTRSFAVADHVRRVAEYDQLLDRLQQLRPNLPPQDQAAVLAAESVLTRLVNGPLDLQDLRDLRNVVASLDLSVRMEDLGALPDVG